MILGAKEMLSASRKIALKSIRNWQPSITRAVSTQQSPAVSHKKDIDVLGMSQGFVDANYKQSWYYFFQLCNRDKLDSLSHHSLSELLRSIQLPTHCKTPSHDARQAIQQKTSIVLRVMESKSFQPSEADLRYLVSIYSILGNYSEARASWDRLTKAFPQPELQSYTALAMCFNRERKFASVPALHQQVRKAGLRANHKFLQCLIEAYGELRNGDMVMKIYRDVLELAEDQLQRDFFALVLNALLKCEPVYFGFVPQLFERMLQLKYPPTEKHFQAVIRNYGHHGAVEDAAFWFSKMKEFGITPTVDVFLRYLAKYAHTKLPESIVPLFSDAEFSHLLTLRHSVRLRWFDPIPGRSYPYDRVDAFFSRLEHIRAKSNPAVKSKRVKKSHLAVEPLPSDDVPSPQLAHA